MSPDDLEKLNQRCPRLGGPVGFYYCFQCGDNGCPCWKIIDCWWEYFDVKSYLAENLPEQVYTKLLTTKPKPKVLSLVELIEQARNRKE